MLRLAAASLAGTAIEFYDFFVYGTAAALVLGPLFFPAFSPVAGTLAAFVTFGAGFVARPLGSVLFGHIGDRRGRRPVLVGSLLLTGAATVAVGCVPTYESIGVAAPALLLMLRFLQGLGLGGEWGGAVLLTAEHAPAERRALWSSFPQVGPALGFLLANGVVLALSATLSDAQFAQWGCGCRSGRRVCWPRRGCGCGRRSPRAPASWRSTTTRACRSRRSCAATGGSSC